MGTKSKDDWLSIKLGKDLKKQVKEIVDSDDEYENMSAFAREAIIDKIDPARRLKRNQEDLLKLLRDPAIRRDLGLQ